MNQDKSDKTWEELLVEAITALEKAEAAMDNIAGWSGSSGNWGLHDTLMKVRVAIKLLNAPLDYTNER